MFTNVVIPPQLHHTLLAYTQWLNDWYEEGERWLRGLADEEGLSGPPPGDELRPYSVDSFTVSNGRDCWGGWEQLAHADTGVYDVYTFSVWDGDEGGGHVLTAWFRTEAFGDPNVPEHIVQEFDTGVQFILQAGQFVNLPTEGK